MREAEEGYNLHTHRTIDNPKAFKLGVKEGSQILVDNGDVRQTLVPSDSHQRVRSQPQVPTITNSIEPCLTLQWNVVQHTHRLGERDKFCDLLIFYSYYRLRVALAPCSFCFG